MPASAWIDKARHDLSAARHLFTPGTMELAIAANLCQQAGESR